jgi:hypothetical protein
VKYVVNDQIVLLRPPEGPLAAFIRPFSGWASEQGYALDSLRQRIWIAVGFSRWLGKKALRPPDVHSRHAAQYLQHRARRMSIYPGDALALQQFQKFLCDQGVVSAERYLREDSRLSSGAHRTSSSI